MAHRRGFVAELQRQVAAAERERLRDRQRALAGATRQRAQSQRNAVAAQAAARRAVLKAQAKYDADAKREYLQSRESEAATMTRDIEVELAAIDSILVWSLKHPLRADLNALRAKVAHPAFKSQHSAPALAVAPLMASPEPRFVPPRHEGGLAGLLGRKKHEAALVAAQAAFTEVHRLWQVEVSELPSRQAALDEARLLAESRRIEKLGSDRARYDRECAARQAETDKANAELDSFINVYREGQKEAVEDYIELVLGKTEFPEAVDVHIDYDFAAADKELDVKLRVPKPEDLPKAKAYRYVKAKDEIAATTQTLKEQRDRYNALVPAIVLRVLHELFSTDIPRHIQTVSLIAHVDHIDPATGRMASIPLIAIAIDRSSYDEIDLANVVPLETLKYLRAVVSKNFAALTPIELKSGVRR